MSAAPTKRQRLSDTDTKPPPKKTHDNDGADPTAAATAADDNVATHTFPQRLMEMLDAKIAPDAIWWAEEGKAFAIDLDKFEHVLHHHFQATKYASFTRKLNKWYVQYKRSHTTTRLLSQFSTIKALAPNVLPSHCILYVVLLRGFRKQNNSASKQSESVVVYRHDLFQKGSPELLTTMSTKRKKVKKDKTDTKFARKKKSDGNERSAVDERHEVDDGQRNASFPEERLRIAGYTALSGRAIPEAEAKAGEAKRPAYSLSSIVSNRRFLDQQPFEVRGTSPSLDLRGTSPSLDWLQQRALHQGRLGINAASLLRSDEHDRMLRDPLAVVDVDLMLQYRAQMQALTASELYGRRDQQLLSDEMIAQRQLSAASFLHRSVDASSFSLQDRQLAADQSTSGGLASANSMQFGRPTSVADISSVRDNYNHQDFSSMTSSLRGYRSQSTAAAMPSSLALRETQSLPDTRGPLREYSEQLFQRQHHASLLPSRQMGFPLSDSPSAERHLLLQQQQRHELQLSAAANSGLGRMSAGFSRPTHASAAEQQLVAIMLERQRLEAQLLDEQRKRQQHK